jgi:AcrR family transcriptional regulator
MAILGATCRYPLSLTLLPETEKLLSPESPTEKKQPDTVTHSRSDGATKAGKKTDRRKAPQTKEKILDAAEALFVQKGYYGTSLRDISRAAGAQLALSYYHFGSKEDLFRAVIDRRADENVADLRGALVRVTAGGKSPTVEEVLSAFIEPVVEKVLRGGEGWRNYIRLLAQVAHMPQEESFLVPVNIHYDAVVREFVEQMARLFPDMAREDVHWGFYFYQAAITDLLNEPGMVDRQSDGLCRASDLETIVKKITRFFAAGFRGIGGLQDR